MDKELYERLKKWLDNGRGLKVNGRIIGKSGSGKTTFIEKYCEEDYKIWLIKPPNKCESIDLFRAIFERIQYHPQTGITGLSKFREVVYHRLQSDKIEMIIVDDAHLLKLGTFTDVRHFHDKFDIPVVLAGTVLLEKLIVKDEQVCYRFMRSFKLPDRISEIADESDK